MKLSYFNFFTTVLMIYVFVMLFSSIGAISFSHVNDININEDYSQFEKESLKLNMVTLLTISFLCFILSIVITGIWSYFFELDYTFNSKYISLLCSFSFAIAPFLAIAGNALLGIYGINNDLLQLGVYLIFYALIMLIVDSYFFGNKKYKGLSKLRVK